MFGVCGGTLSSDAVQARGTHRRGLSSHRDVGQQEQAMTGGDDAVTAAAGDTRAGELQA